MPRPKSTTLLPNGYLQTLKPKDIPGSSSHSFLALDTETTGTDFHRPYPGFTHSAAPYCISYCQYDSVNQTLTAGYFLGEVDPHTRAVFWKASTLTLIRRLLASYRPYNVHPRKSQRKAVRPANLAPRPYVFHNSPFDLRALSTIGIEIDLDLCEDTLPAFHILNSAESHGLKDIGVKYLDILDLDETLLKAKTEEALHYAREHGIPLSPEPIADRWLISQYLHHPALTDYATLDAIRTAKAWLLAQRALVQFKAWPSYTRERRIAKDVYRMTSHPIHFRYAAAQDLCADYQHKANTYRETCLEVAGNPGLNLNSPKQLSTVLHEQLALPVMRRTSSQQPSTDKYALADLHRHALETSHQDALLFIESMSDYRRFDKAASTIDTQYLSRALFAHNRWWLWPSFKPWATVTTRFASGGEAWNDYNQQNVAGNDEETQTRECFGPPPGWYWYSLDFNQLELRLMAHASGDATLHEILKTSGDAYVVLRDTLNTERQRLGIPLIEGKAGRKWAKVIWLAWQYGLGVNKFSRMAGLPADDLIAAMRAHYSGVVDFMHRCSSIVRRDGYIRTLFGYPLHIRPEINPYTGEPELPHYKGTNYVIQGSAGDILKNTIISINDFLDHHRLTSDCHILMNIHDELILQTRRRFGLLWLRDIAAIAAAAGDPIGCPTPVKLSRIREHWFAPEELAL